MRVGDRWDPISMALILQTIGRIGESSIIILFFIKVCAEVIWMVGNGGGEWMPQAL